MSCKWALLSCLIAVAASAQGVPEPPSLDAKSYFVFDHTSQHVIAQKRPDARLHPASLTKLMTSYIAFRKLDEQVVRLEDQVLVSEKAWRTGGSRMFVEVGTHVSLGALLKGLIVQSGNDASIAIAEHIAGSEAAFVELMNQQAAALGMRHTSYRNSTGLPARNHYSTARDMAVLARAIISQFPHYYPFFSQREFTYNDIRQYNRNKLLWRDASVDGLKTGYTVAAGYCMVSSAEREGMRLIAVVMGMSSSTERLDGSRALLEYGFRNFETTRLFAGGEPISHLRVWKGMPETVPVGVNRDVYVTTPRGNHESVSASASVPRLVVAPLQINQQIGQVNVRFDGQTLLAEPLVALTRVPIGGLWSRFLDEVELWLD